MSRSALVALAFAAAATVAGCGGEDGTFRLLIQWRDRADQPCPPLAEGASRRCQSIPMTCAAKARVRIIDASDSNLVYYSECFDLAGGGDACKLGGLPITPKQIPNRMVKVQMMVWPVDSLVGVEVPIEGCPVTTEFANGVPKLIAPVPALGGEAYFAVGKDRTAEIELGCPDWMKLSCPDTSVILDAQLFDPETFLRLGRDTVQLLTVRFGAPVADGLGAWEIGNQQLQGPLAATTTGEPSWQLRLPQAPTAVSCLWVQAAVAESTPSLTCFDPVVDGSGVMHARGFVATTSLVRRIEQSLGNIPFPSAGMVIGMVVDDQDLPVAGAEVHPVSGTVVYPETDFLTVRFDHTSANGFFVSRDAPFDTGWSATSGAITDDGTARGGLVKNVATVVLIRMGTQLSPIDASVAGPPVDGGM